jgi:hypothetical protein
VATETCKCSLNNFLDILKNETVKDMLRGPKGNTGLPGLTVSLTQMQCQDFLLQLFISQRGLLETEELKVTKVILARWDLKACKAAKVTCREVYELLTNFVFHRRTRS